MDKIIGKVVDIQSDTENIWFSLKVTLSYGMSIPEQEVYFDCRIADYENYNKALWALKSAKDNETSVELGGYMMIDNPEENEVQMWFSVFKMTFNGEVVYDIPAPKCQFVLS